MLFVPSDSGSDTSLDVSRVCNLRRSHVQTALNSGTNLALRECPINAA
jgi:hypothetical protein